MKPAAREIYDLGTHLRDIFKLDISGREQGQLSGGGKVWESLVLYYLNLGFAGTDVVVVSDKNGIIPSSIQDATAITYGNNALKSDLDVICFSCPALSENPSEKTEKDCFKGVQKVVNTPANFSDTAVVNLQCKTNWNDNAQIPMLWEHIFKLARSSNLPSASYTVGENGYNISQLVNFTYGFATVPTNDIEKIKPSSMQVCRVRTLSGGYYWGFQTRKKVCSNIKEFFDVHYGKTPSHFPDPSDIGVAFSRELIAKKGDIDWKAFDLI